MFNLRHLVFLVAICSIFNHVSTCTLSVYGMSPLFTQTFGTRTIAFKAREGIVNFEDSVRAYCSHGEVNIKVTEYSYYGNNYVSQGENTVVFQCSNDAILISGTSHNILEVSCSNEVKLKIYESRKVLPKCDGFTNYAIGFTHIDVGEVIKAGICYDLDALTLKFAVYVVSSKNAFTFEKERNSNVLPVSLDFDLKTTSFDNYFDLVNKNSLNGDLANQFQVESLIQHAGLRKELQHFDSTLNAIWWRQLRGGNWHHFIEALDQRTKSAKKSYTVSTGTYGNITMPSPTNNCTSLKPELLTVKTKETEVLVPAYVWAYVKSLDADDAEEFVVIGHNSPYTIDPNHNAFCAADICDTIEWLKKSEFGYLRRLPGLGYTFCCHPEEVAKIIDYFPLSPATQWGDTTDDETKLKSADQVDDYYTTESSVYNYWRNYNFDE
uniref:Uncharacterized protein MG342 n=2 Tax=Zeugodacus cucurbitae TaxID=28588 RepID=A0A0A1WH28_ZEUCU